MAPRKLLQIDAATLPETPRVPPGNRLEAPSDRKGQHAIRVNGQWRICFLWREGDAHDVEIVDYHRAGPGDDRLPPVHPGETLLEDFLKPMALSQYRRALGVPPQRVHDLVHGRRAITADTALRLARAFSMEARFWLNLQSRYDLEVATDRLQARIEAEVVPLVA